MCFIYCLFFLLIDPNLKDQGNQQSDGSQLPINMMQQQMNVMPQVNAQHQPMNIFPYPVGVHPPMMNMQRNPFNIHPPMPMHLPTGVPLIQVAAPTNLSQGLPPPPPPPPPSQQVSYIASQQDGKQLQVCFIRSHGKSSIEVTSVKGFLYIEYHSLDKLILAVSFSLAWLLPPHTKFKMEVSPRI